MNHLLNCYLREFASPQQLVDWQAQGDLPKALQSELLQGETVRIRMAYPMLKIAFKAQSRGLLNQIKLGSKIFGKPMGKPWQVLSTECAINALLEHMALLTQTEFNTELKAQIHNSLENMQAFLGRHAVPYFDDLQHTEQSLLWGHPFHPSPKSRSGVSNTLLLECSPEVGASFQLHWFNIHPSLLLEYGQPTAQNICHQLTGRQNLYPCHPWEVERILQSATYQKASTSGLIQYLGPQGQAVWPTSSVRTLYHPELNVFIKCSIHVRLTNCVRKNAWYELESAVGMTALLDATFKQVEQKHLGFYMLREPGASTLDFTQADPNASAENLIDLKESFGIVYREKLPMPAGQIHLAGALASWNIKGESQLENLLAKESSLHCIGQSEFTLKWLRQYFELIVPSTFELLFQHGVVLEPHLQNTLLGLHQGLPAQVWVRDLEGTKLVYTHWPEHRLKGLSTRAIDSVHYSQDQGWKRVSYCLLVNNLAEIIFHACQHRPHLETHAWDILFLVIEKSSQSLGSPIELERLTQGHPLPSKNNLKTRLFKKADRLSDYTYLANPLPTNHDTLTEHIADSTSSFGAKPLVRLCL